MALRTRRSVPSRETGLMPMPEVFGEADLLDAHLVLQELDELLGLVGLGFEFDAGVDVFGVLAEDHHVGLLGSLTGEGTPLKYCTGRRQTYRSSSWRSATFSERMPPPTGVVSGPLMDTT
jgi:hypothetical protein